MVLCINQSCAKTDRSKSSFQPYITFHLELWKLETNDSILEGMMDNSRYDCIQRELYAIVSLHALGLICPAVLNYCRYVL